MSNQDIYTNEEYINQALLVERQEWQALYDDTCREWRKDREALENAILTIRLLQSENEHLQKAQKLAQ